MEQRKKESGIRLEDVAAGYGRKSLLNHISLHVSPGNVLTLIGPNGAGKSTNIKNRDQTACRAWRNDLSGGDIHEPDAGRGSCTDACDGDDGAASSGIYDLPRGGCDRQVSVYRKARDSLREDWKLVVDAMRWMHAGAPRTGIFHRSATDRDSG